VVISRSIGSDSRIQSRQRAYSSELQVQGTTQTITHPLPNSAICADRMGKVSFVETPEKYDYDIEDVEDGNPTSVFPYQETAENKSWAGTLPLKQGLYDPELEKDACGVGFAAYVPKSCV
jgi:hypothetical protein